MNQTLEFERTWWTQSSRLHLPAVSHEKGTFFQGSFQTVLSMPTGDRCIPNQCDSSDESSLGRLIARADDSSDASDSLADALDV